VFKQRQQSLKHFVGTNKQVYRNLIKVQSQRQWDPLLKTKQSQIDVPNEIHTVPTQENSTLSPSLADDG